MNDSAAKILIVDDEPRSLYAMEMLLYREPYRVLLADGGHSALRQVEEHTPDVILLDVMMPDMTGYEVCLRLKADDRWRHIPIVLVTALNRKEDVVRGLDAGADEFLTKPVNGPELRARIRSMLRIKRQYDEIQETLQMREELANMIVHDMRTPLSTITLYSDILMAKTQQNGSAESYANLLETIRLQSYRLNSFLGDMLILAKMRAGKLMLNRIDVDPRSVVQSVAEVHRVAAQSKDVAIDLEMPGTFRKFGLDVKLIQRMVDNLLSNAIKFTPRGSTVTLRMAYAEDEADSAESRLCLEVRDQGPGVPEAYRESIFEKFETGAARNGVPQIGLGLALCRMVAEAHGGRIAVRDNDPQGAVFTVEF